MYEPEESNPMLGWRGASRYYDETFKPAFVMECQAVKKAIQEFGLKNIIVMVPFCRTIEEAKKVMDLIRKSGLDKVKVYMMCEIPSNVVLVDEFSKLFDSYSLGTNDLTQLFLGIDRDNAKLAPIFQEDNEAIKRTIKLFIKNAHKYKKEVGICGEAPATIPGFVDFLIDCGIDSISVNPNSVIKTILSIKRKKK